MYHSPKYKPYIKYPYMNSEKKNQKDEHGDEMVYGLPRAESKK